MQMSRVSDVYLRTIQEKGQGVLFRPLWPEISEDKRRRETEKTGKKDYHFETIFIIKAMSMTWINILGLAVASLAWAFLDIKMTTKHIVAMMCVVCGMAVFFLQK